MVSLNEIDYKSVAQELLAAISEKDFYNGIIEFSGENFIGFLKTSLIIYRAPFLDPEYESGKRARITEIIPVWWECSTFHNNGVTTNDFSWNELKTYLL